MSREEKLREIAEQEQALMREIYGFDAGVKWAEARIMNLLEQTSKSFERYDFNAVATTNALIELIKGEAE